MDNRLDPDKHNLASNLSFAARVRWTCMNPDCGAKVDPSDIQQVVMMLCADCLPSK